MDDEQPALQPLRDRIDLIDEQLLALLNQRAGLALEIGAIKKHFKTPIFRPERELLVFTRLQALNQGPLQTEQIAAIWREIMAASRALEKPFTAAFLGPVGTYSEEALHQYSGSAVEALPCPSIDEVFRAVEAGAAKIGIVPIENSTEGAVSRTLDLLLDSSLKLSGEVVLPIQHNLLTRTGTLAGVSRVCAHAQALAQCQHWLMLHAPHLERQAVASNAVAAQLAAEDASVAAIASERAATRYNLAIVQAMIQDDPHNRTRFVVIGEQACAPTGRDQTALILAVKNVAGAVFRMLEPLARHGVSMTRFESRPAKSGAWEYYFYIDLAGHYADAPLAAAFAELEQSAAFIKILGSYPRAH